MGEALIPKETAITGCNRKCACRLWVNCAYYNNQKWVKSREQDIERRYTPYHEWYDVHFRAHIEMPIAGMNG